MKPLFCYLFTVSGRRVYSGGCAQRFLERADRPINLINLFFEQNHLNFCSFSHISYKPTHKLMFVFIYIFVFFVLLVERLINLTVLQLVSDAGHELKLFKDRGHRLYLHSTNVIERLCKVSDLFHILNFPCLEPLALCNALELQDILEDIFC